MVNGGGNGSGDLQSFPEYDKLWKLSDLDGFVKSPSVPLGAGLHFNFVVAAHLVSALHSSVFVRLVPPVAGEFFTKPSFW